MAPMSPLEHFPDYLKAIGTITVEMGALEAHLVHLLAAMMGVQESLAIKMLMTQTSTRGRMDTLKNVAEGVLSAEDYRSVEPVIDKALKLLNKRNAYVHSVWGTTADRTQVVRSDGGKAAPFMIVTIQELTNLIDRLRTVSIEVLKCTSKIGRSRTHYKINLTYNRRPG